MIRTDLRTQVMRCTECGTCLEIPRHVIGNPERVMMAEGYMRNQHANCRNLPAVPETVETLQQRINARLRRELDKAGLVAS